MSRRIFNNPPDVSVESRPTDIQRTVDLLDDFVYERIEEDDGNALHVFRDQSTVMSDLSFAARCGGATYQAIIDRFNVSKKSADALAALRSKLTDEQLMDTIKSKYIQTPSELINYMQGLNDDFNLAAQQVLDEINGKSQPSDGGEPTATENVNSDNMGAS